MLRKPIQKVEPSKIPIIATVTTITASIGAFFAEFTPHTFFIDKYKTIIQAHKFGDPVPLKEDAEKLFNEVLDDLKLSEEEKKRYTPFPIAAFNLYNAGTPDKFQGIIGIPFNYSYTDRSHLNLSEIRLGRNKELVNIYHPAAEDLVSSLLLSTNAMKFGIAREVLMCQKQLPIYRSVETPLMIIATFFTSEFARLKFKLANKPPVVSAVVYGLSGILGFSVWFQIRDNLNMYFEKSVDEELAKLGPNYVEGGKEFYQKELDKNIAVRKLMGPRGTKLYNRDGDELFFIRRKKTPLTYRKKFFSDFVFQENEQTA